MRRYLTSLSLLILLFLGGMAVAAPQHDSASGQNDQKSSPSNNHTQPLTGEQVFQQNCARCHQPPMSISPRTTGTIIMHMRVRARLSRQDEQLLLKYLAP